MLTSDADTLPQAPTVRDGVLRPGGFANLMRSPGAKFVTIGILAALLLIPTLLIWGLVEERAQRAQDVSARISQGWGGEQAINGPYLAVPFTVTRQVQNGSTTISVNQTEWVLLMPDDLDIDARLQTESRKLSIYSLPVYNARLTINGKFSSDLAATLDRREGTPHLDRAYLIMSIADLTGIRSDAGIRFNGGQPQPFEPGMKGFTTPFFFNQSYSGSTAGINRPVESELVERGFAFEMELSLNGSSRFAVAPSGQTTKLSASANWPHPGFEGRFLPEKKTITAQDFAASWTIPYLARGIDRVVVGQELPLAHSLMTINLIEPVKFYQIVSRSLKYSVGFISLMFFAVFVIEIKGGRAMHWVQYVITGLALLIFYVLLLALCEHIGFSISYAIASVATTAIISLYVAAVTSCRRTGTSLAILLALSYGVLYLILREDEFALLAGAIISFLIIAATMYFTRNIDWSGSAKSQ